MAIAFPVFSSFSLDERQGIETREDPLAQAVFDIGWGRGYTLDMNVREIQAKTLLAHVKQPDTGPAPARSAHFARRLPR